MNKIYFERDCNGIVYLSTLIPVVDFIRYFCEKKAIEMDLFMEKGRYKTISYFVVRFPKSIAI